MSEKTVLLNGAEVEFDRFKRAIAGLSEAEMRETWCGTWAVRDIAAHISGWHREIGQALERLARGEKPVPEGVNYMDADPWNARFAAAKTSASTAEILAELDASHAYFMEKAKTVDEARIVPEKTAYKLIDLNSRRHYQEHTVDIEAWRRSRNH